MGICASCCGGQKEKDTLLSPDVETRRRQQAEAAERRIRENESRGVKDSDKVKRMQKKAEELEKREREAAMSGGGASLKWQMG